MRTDSFSRKLALLCIAAASLVLQACASSPETTATPAPAMDELGRLPLGVLRTSGDPRIGLKPGRYDAAQAAWNMRLVSNTRSPAPFDTSTNSDLAFTGNLVIQGNYNGFQVWDVSNPRRPGMKKSYVCPASQSDVSVFKNLLFVSGEGLTGRLDCGMQGVPDTVSKERLRGIRIFDITDISNPKYIANVQTCRGSHTHTVVTPQNDPNNVYIYVSGSSSVRRPEELPGCVGWEISTRNSEAMAALANDPNTSFFRIEVIKVPLANPQQAAIVGGARFFAGLSGAPTRDSLGNVTTRPVSPNQCHDITVYPAVGLGGGACGGYGLLLDLSDVANPRRIDAAADPNMSFWHSATFSNDGHMVLFTDEWGGGSAARCRATDKYEWGSNALFTIVNRKMQFQSYYKLPAVQTSAENCVAHNGSLIPIPGREIMVQGWYQGGVSVFEWTDPKQPREIAFFDRGPINPENVRDGGGVWSVYWYNGYMYSSEMARGLDVLELMPSAFISQNEIDAAKTVVFREFNAQEQQKLVWPPSFALARAYVDQLERSNGLTADRIAAVRRSLADAEKRSGQTRSSALTELAAQLNGDAGRSSDAAKVRKLSAAVTDLANVR